MISKRPCCGRPCPDFVGTYGVYGRVGHNGRLDDCVLCYRVDPTPPRGNWPCWGLQVLRANSLFAIVRGQRPNAPRISTLPSLPAGACVRVCHFYCASYCSCTLFRSRLVLFDCLLFAVGARWSVGCPPSTFHCCCLLFGMCCAVLFHIVLSLFVPFCLFFLSFFFVPLFVVLVAFMVSLSLSLFCIPNVPPRLQVALH